jgi:thiamine biosynthesis lipoprotein
VLRYQQQFKALGSEVAITLVGSQYEAYVTSIFNELHIKVDDFEKRFSRFITSSELTFFNSSAGQKTRLSLQFIDLLKVARDLSIKTEGIYNPFILPDLQRAGYMSSWNNDYDPIDYSERKLFYPGDIEIYDDSAKIPTSSAIDFGGIGKGYLLDQLHNYLLNLELDGYWVSLGGDIICFGYDHHETDWQILVQDANSPDKTVGKFSNNDGHFLAIATSGVTKRKGVHQGKAWHHIIDPRTGQPAKTDILTATITADSAKVADVYCKCIVIEGIEEAVKLKSKALIQSYLLQLGGDRATILKS